VGTGNYTDAAVTAEGDVMFAALTRMRVIDRVDLAGQGPGTIRLHTDGQSAAWRASATRDASIIAFEQNIGGEWEIWTKDIRTGAQQLVIRVKAPGQTNATISQDGARIAYTVPRPVTTGQGYVIETNGGVPRLVCEGCGLHGFLSDNRRVLAEMDDGHALRVYDTVTSRFEELVTTTDGLLNRPHASADERWLAFRRTIGTSGKTLVVPFTPGHPVSVERAQQVEEPTTTGRPAGWALEMSILYLLLDTDGFRCLWGQRIDPVSGRLDGQPYPVRHFHGEQMLTAGGVSTSFGNPVTVNGFLYEATAVTGDIWRLRRR
jgi:eukaryotic-like serine/threonine-protein kinase